MAKAAPKAPGKRKRRFGFGPPPAGPIGDAKSIGMLLTPEDVAAIASGAGIPANLDRLGLEAEADTLNEALDRFILYNAIADREAPEAKKTDWCAGLADRVKELRGGLGYIPFDGAERGSVADAMLNLGKAFPVSPRLSWMIARGAPNAGSESDTGRFNDLLEQLDATLRALQEVARASAESWELEIAQGGKDPEHARGRLFRKLRASYWRTFGRDTTVPNVSTDDDSDREQRPSGPALDWHRGFFRRVEDCVFDLEQAKSPRLDPDACRPLYDLAAWAEGKKYGHADGLAKAILSARAEGKASERVSQRPSAPDCV